MAIGDTKQYEPLVDFALFKTIRQNQIGVGMTGNTKKFTSNIGESVQTRPIIFTQIATSIGQPFASPGNQLGQAFAAQYGASSMTWAPAASQYWTQQYNGWLGQFYRGVAEIRLRGSQTPDSTKNGLNVYYDSSGNPVVLVPSQAAAVVFTFQASSITIGYSTEPDGGSCTVTIDNLTPTPYPTFTPPAVPLMQFPTGFGGYGVSTINCYSASPTYGNYTTWTCDPNVLHVLRITPPGSPSNTVNTGPYGYLESVLVGPSHPYIQQGTPPTDGTANVGIPGRGISVRNQAMGGSALKHMFGSVNGGQQRAPEIATLLTPVYSSSTVRNASTEVSNVYFMYPENALPVGDNGMTSAWAPTDLRVKPDMIYYTGPTNDLSGTSGPSQISTYLNQLMLAVGAAVANGTDVTIEIEPANMNSYPATKGGVDLTTGMVDTKSDGKQIWDNVRNVFYQVQAAFPDNCAIFDWDWFCAQLAYAWKYHRPCPQLLSFTSTPVGWKLVYSDPTYGLWTTAAITLGESTDSVGQAANVMAIQTALYNAALAKSGSTTYASNFTVQYQSSPTPGYLILNGNGYPQPMYALDTSGLSGGTVSIGYVLTSDVHPNDWGYGYAGYSAAQALCSAHGLQMPAKATALPPFYQSLSHNTMYSQTNEPLFVTPGTLWNDTSNIVGGELKSLVSLMTTTDPVVVPQPFPRGIWKLESTLSNVGHPNLCPPLNSVQMPLLTGSGFAVPTYDTWINGELRTTYNAGTNPILKNQLAYRTDSIIPSMIPGWWYTLSCIHEIQTNPASGIGFVFVIGDLRYGVMGWDSPTQSWVYDTGSAGSFVSGTNNPQRSAITFQWPTVATLANWVVGTNTSLTGSGGQVIDVTKGYMRFTAPGLGDSVCIMELKIEAGGSFTQGPLQIFEPNPINVTLSQIVSATEPIIDPTPSVSGIVMVKGQLWNDTSTGNNLQKKLTIPGGVLAVTANPTNFPGSSIWSIVGASYINYFASINAGLEMSGPVTSAYNAAIGPYGKTPGFVVTPSGSGSTNIYMNLPTIGGSQIPNGTIMTASFLIMANTISVGSIALSLMMGAGDTSMPSFSLSDQTQEAWAAWSTYGNNITGYVVLPTLQAGVWYRVSFKYLSYASGSPINNASTRQFIMLRGVSSSPTFTICDFQLVAGASVLL